MDLKTFAGFAAPIITVLITFLLNKYFQNKPKLIAYYGNISAHRISGENGEQFNFHTHEVVIRNTGKLPAKNVRVGHNFLPNYNVMPNTKYEVSELFGAGKEILFPVLVPNEQITVSYIYAPPVTYEQINTNIKSDEGFARIIRVIQTPSLPIWQKNILYLFLFLGCSTTIYFTIFIVALLLNI